jgi:DNA-binding NtrC family response regulator
MAAAALTGPRLAVWLTGTVGVPGHRCSPRGRVIMHVLVVDDDETVRASLGDALVSAGVRVSVAAGGQEALDRMAADPVDLLLTDVRMPGVDGLELLRRVRAGAPGADVVLMTAYDDAATALVAAREGARAYLAKPLDLRDLRTLIDRLLRERLEHGERRPRNGGEETEERQRANGATSPKDPSLREPGSVP